MKQIHTTIIINYINNREHNTITNTKPLNVHHSQTNPPIATRRTLVQRRTNKCPIITLICKQNRRWQTPITTMPLLQNRTTHLFNCSKTHFSRSRIWGLIPLRWRVYWLNGMGSPFGRCAWMPTEWGNTFNIDHV